ncbi:MAG: UDP-N-acetylmuramoyl-L-alanine--D-glutamate ligase [Candidatus Nomurabacteria bacterium]|nr:UDP-N-acetylmuramoyl-L-alanine--D-glutamate ligase [Candidatus Nomurabacteria bacterium]
MQNYKNKFKGKKITIMGLGILGRGLGYTKFLAECGADIIVTDLKTKEQLATSIKALNKFKNIKYILGEHRLEDFKNRDMVIKAAGVPFDSIYIEEAKKNYIPIEMDVSLFSKCAPGVMLIGVTGTRGKSMTTTLIYEILKSNENFLNKKVYLGGNIRGVATLPLLKKVKEGDILVCELDSWQLQGFCDSKVSPHISVFTTFMPDHMNYYKNSMDKYFNDKANIFKFQNKNDILVIRPNMKKLIPKSIKSELVVINKNGLDGWKFIVPGDHQRENLACAVKVAEELGVPIYKIKKAVSNFKGLEGRLELLRVYKGIKIYNDNNATTPEATIAGIEALNNNKKNIILVCGGSDKKLILDDFVKTINKYCKTIVLIPGSGTEVLINPVGDFTKSKLKLKIKNEVGKDLKDVIQKALVQAKKGDTILFSPAFASFGMFNNEYERNDLFIDIIKRLK